MGESLFTDKQGMEKYLAIYVRTSTDKQETGLEAQLMSCKDYCAKCSIANFRVFSDDDQSGDKEHRPAFDEMKAACARGEVDRVLVYSLNRLSRRVAHSYLMVEEFRSQGVQLISCTETIDTDTPEGRLLFGILAVFAQFQREDIVRKVRNGLENARRKGVKLGRKKTREDAPIKKLLEQGMKPGDVARTLGISRGSVYRVLKACPNLLVPE